MNIKKNINDLYLKIVDAIVNGPSWIQYCILVVAIAVAHVYYYITGKDPIKGHQEWKYKLINGVYHRKKRGLIHMFSPWIDSTFRNL
jgi:hypothetical protein